MIKKGDILMIVGNTGHCYKMDHLVEVTEIGVLMNPKYVDVIDGEGFIQVLEPDDYVKIGEL